MSRRKANSILVVAAVATFASTHAHAQEQPPEAAKPKTRLELYGFAMTDLGYNFGAIDPAWFDVMRPTKLPAFSGEFGANGRLFEGVRQSRFGVKSFEDTPLGELKSNFEFELFGVAEDAGQTTFRLRHFYGQLGPVLAGQTWSAFMDPDVFPNSLEYWGPSAMVFYRNVQVRFMPLQGDTSAAIALERPGSTQDLGSFQETIALQNVSARFPLPDLSANFRHGGGWGHVQVAGIVRYIKWDDLSHTAVNLSGEAWGWGASVSSNLKFLGENVLKLQVTGGRAVQNYINDAGPDVGVEPTGNVTAPFRGVGMNMIGFLAFVDLHWSALLTSSVGYSAVWIDNAAGQTADAFKRGQYALANLLVHPHKNFMFGVEGQWGQRLNHSDGWQYDDFKVQASLKYNFSLEIPK